MSEQERTDIESVDASVIEDELMFSSRSFEVDMSGIQRDIEDLTLAIDDALTVYGDLLVDSATIANISYDDARRCERATSAAVRRADELRRKLNRDYKLPLDHAKARYDELMGPLIDLHAAYRQRRIDLDEAAQTQKKQMIQQAYESMAPHIALPLAGQEEALVPFERMFHAYGGKWLNKSADLDGIGREIAGIVLQIAEGEKQIEAAAPAHLPEAKATYFQTLDVKTALAMDRQICAMEQRQAVLEAQRAAAELAGKQGEATGASSGGMPTVAQAQMPLAPADDASDALPQARSASAARKPRVMIIDGATDDECRQIGQFCRQLGITGIFKGERFHQAVASLLS